jgi:hypothetical protein
MRVKCINNNYYTTELTQGKIYVVKDEHSSLGIDYYFLEGVVGGWQKNRFVVVDENTPTTINAPAIRQEKSCTTCGKPNDVGVHTCWNCGNQP